MTTLRSSLLSAASIAALAALASSPSPAAASVTRGQLAPSPAPATCGTLRQDFLQPSVTSGNSYVVPGNGTITSWSTNAYANPGQMWTMKIFRKVADPARYEVVGHEGPRTLAAGALNSFPAAIPVKPGDVLGMNDNDGSAAVSACRIDVPDEALYLTGALTDGASASFNTIPDSRLNIRAVFNPTNTFTLGATNHNKKKGTATLNLTLPNPGELTGSGKGIKASSARARISKAVVAGAAQLLIKAKGKKKKALNDTSKVTLKVAVTYTPTAGDPSSQSVKVKLRKK